MVHNETSGEEQLAKDIEFGRLLFTGQCDFIAAAANMKALPPVTLPEICFAGRSNVGKSSLVNALTGRRMLARTSQTPGRTRQLIFFNLSGRLQFRGHLRLRHHRDGDQTLPTRPTLQALRPTHRARCLLIPPNPLR